MDMGENGFRPYPWTWLCGGSVGFIAWMPTQGRPYNKIDRLRRPSNP